MPSTTVQKVGGAFVLRRGLILKVWADPGQIAGVAAINGDGHPDLLWR